MIEYTEEDVNMLKYFYEEKGDITRYANWVVLKIVSLGISLSWKKL